MGSCFFHSKLISFNTAIVAADKLLLLTLKECVLLLLANDNLPVLFTVYLPLPHSTRVI